MAPDGVDEDGNLPTLGEVMREALTEPDLRRRLDELLMPPLTAALSARLGGTSVWVSALPAEGLTRLKRDIETAEFLRTADAEQMSKRYSVSRATLYRLGWKRPREALQRTTKRATKPES